MFARFTSFTFFIFISRVAFSQCPAPSSVSYSPNPLASSGLVTLSATSTNSSVTGQTWYTNKNKTGSSNNSTRKIIAITGVYVGTYSPFVTSTTTYYVSSWCNSTESDTLTPLTVTVSGSTGGGTGGGSGSGGSGGSGGGSGGSGGGGGTGGGSGSGGASPVVGYTGSPCSGKPILFYFNTNGNTCSVPSWSTTPTATFSDFVDSSTGKVSLWQKYITWPSATFESSVSVSASSQCGANYKEYRYPADGSNLILDIPRSPSVLLTTSSSVLCEGENGSVVFSTTASGFPFGFNAGYNYYIDDVFVGSQRSSTAITTFTYNTNLNLVSLLKGNHTTKVRMTFSDLPCLVGNSYAEASSSFDVKSVSVPASTTINYYCDYAVITFNGIPADGSTWYWRDADGSFTNSAQAITVYSPDTYYYRAKNSCGFSSIGSASTVPGWKKTPDIPKAQVQSYDCGSATLAFIGTVPSPDITWFWTDLSGSPANSTSPRTVSVNGTYSVQASSNGCTSGTFSLSTTSGWRPTPVAPTASITNYGCDKADIQFLGAPSSKDIWYLKDKNGTILSSYSSLPGSFSVFTITKPETYYVMASGSGGCESASNSIAVSTTSWKSTPTAPPAIPDPIYGCGSAVVNVPTGKPAGVAWYWQAAADGTTGGAEAAPLTVTSPSDHYLRASASGCWSPATKASTMSGWKYNPTQPVTVDMIAKNYLCATNLKPLVSFNANDNNTYVKDYRWTHTLSGLTTVDTREKSPLLLLAPGSYNMKLDLVLGYSGNDCTAASSGSKTHTIAPYTPSVDNTTVEVTTPVIDQVINASASTFSDSWPLPPDVPALLSSNSFLNGTQGVWRNNGAYAYKSENERAKFDGTNLKTAGTFSLNSFDWTTAQLDMVPNWIKSNTMTLYNSYGNELENKDVLGIYSSALYDYGGHLPTATGANMRNNEMAYTGFEVQKAGGSDCILTDNATGNFVFANQPTKSMFWFEVPYAIEYAALVDASMEDLELITQVDIRAEKTLWSGYNSKEFNYLKGVNIICRSPHPTNPKQTLIVLEKTPFSSADQSFIGSWNGQLIFYKTPPASASAVLDCQVAHTGKGSLKISGADQTFDQPLLALDGGKTYWVSGWVKKTNSKISTAGISVLIKDKLGVLKETVGLSPSGPVIEGWQQVKGTFTPSISKSLISLQFRPGSADPVWFDDLRLHPQNGNMKTYVYNLSDYRLRAILDEENFASLFYYDTEGNLYLTKKETEKGIKTLTENVSYQVKREP